MTSGPLSPHKSLSGTLEEMRAAIAGGGDDERVGGEDTGRDPEDLRGAGDTADGF
jgi:hypothetical protein